MVHGCSQPQQLMLDAIKQIVVVTTLDLGSRPKQGLTRLEAKREAREPHLMFPGVQKNVKE